MSSRITKRFEALRGEKQKALIAFITAGDPTQQDTPRFVDALVAGGIDVLELGLPFSDPVADGPVICRANQRSLAAGMNTDRYFSLVKDVAGKHPDLPKVCMTYYNLLLARGLERFSKDAARAGIDGLVIPDLPLEESGPLKDACAEHGIDLILLAAPTTTDDRLKRIARQTEGFLYVVSFLGVTGSEKRVSSSVKELVEKVGGMRADLPVSVGFGIASPGDVRDALSTGADAAIVGSAFIRAIEEHVKAPARAAAELGDLATTLKEPTRNAQKNT